MFSLNAFFDDSELTFIIYIFFLKYLNSFRRVLICFVLDLVKWTIKILIFILFYFILFMILDPVTKGPYDERC